jgi:hypothetical protein
MNMDDRVQLMVYVCHLYLIMMMDSNCLHGRMNYLDKLNPMLMISIDNDVLMILYDYELLNVNVNDMIQ